MLVITLLLGVIGVTLLVYLLSKIAKLTDDLSQKMDDNADNLSCLLYTSPSPRDS